jgi:hypothetical protein
VTAYVGAVLAAMDEARATEAATAAWTLLERRGRPAGTWGYNPLPPGDADSTGWGLLLAAGVGAGGSERALEARQALACHLRSDAGIATYAEERPIRRFIGAPDERSFQGWCGAQPCVSAAVAALPEFFPQVRPYLRRTQRADGSWRSYWWCDDEYATALAAEALVRGGWPEDRPLVARAVQWMRRRLDPAGRVPTPRCPDGSPFATAWCLRMLMLSGEAGVAAARLRATRWLVHQQQPDGSWAPSALLRVPLPEDEHPERYTGWLDGGKIEGSIVVDQRAVFTTATVLGALLPLRERAGAHAPP